MAAIGIYIPQQNSGLVIVGATGQALIQLLVKLLPARSKSSAGLPFPQPNLNYAKAARLSALLLS